MRSSKRARKAGDRVGELDRKVPSLASHKPRMSPQMEGYERNATGKASGSNSVERVPIDCPHVMQESVSVPRMDQAAL